MNYENTIMDNEINISLLKQYIGKKDIITEANIKETARNLLDKFIKLCVRIKEAIQKKFSELKRKIFELSQKFKKSKIFINTTKREIEVEATYVNHKVFIDKVKNFVQVVCSKTTTKIYDDDDEYLNYDAIINEVFGHTGSIALYEMYAYFADDPKCEFLETSKHKYSIYEQKQIIDTNEPWQTLNAEWKKLDGWLDKINKDLKDDLNSATDYYEIAKIKHVITDYSSVGSICLRMYNTAFTFSNAIIDTAYEVLNAAGIPVSAD